MAKKKVSVGLIGFGRWGRVLHEKLSKFADIKFVCTSKDSYIDKLYDVDWVVVATPDRTHYKIVKECILRGKNVFCEKPLTPTFKESKELVELARKNNVKLYVDSVFNYRKSRSRVHNYISSVNEIEVKWNKKSDKVITQAFHLLGYHDIYLLYPVLKDRKLRRIKVLEKTSRKISFMALFSDNLNIKFTYDLESNVVEHKFDNIDFTVQENDALLEMLQIVMTKTTKVNFKLNQDVALFTNKLIDQFKKKLFKKVAVIGAGIFGSTIASELAEDVYDVTLFEKNSDIITAASYINQYRIHRGYHYPRSVETAMETKQGTVEFTRMYKEAVVDKKIKNCYAIAKKDSKVTAKQFIDFMKVVGLEHKKIKLNIVNDKNVDLTIEANEGLFDPEMLKKICWQNLKKNNVEVILNSKIYNLKDFKDYDYVIIATYRNLNKLLPKNNKMDLQFELCEKPVVKLPAKYKNKSIVILDGPFMCADPLGDTPYHVMGNVVHAIHSSNVGHFPLIPEGFEELLDSGIVKNPHITNIDKFIESAKDFLVDIEKLEHIGSMYTFRTVLPNRDHDDARPTLVNRIDNRLIYIFSGKVSTCVEAASKVKEMLNDDN